MGGNLLNLRYLKRFSWILGIVVFFHVGQGWTQTSLPTTTHSSEAAIVATAVAALPAANGLGPIPTAGNGISTEVSPVPTSDARDVSEDFSLSPEEEAKVLKAIDAENGVANGVPSRSKVSVFHPPPVPTGVAVIVLKEGVYLSWDTSPAGSTTAYYNVYRSTTPGMGYKQVNIKPLNAAYFLDGASNSLQLPQNGEDYFYVVAAVDGQGDMSPYSDEIAITPTGMEIAQSSEELNAIRVAKQTAPEQERVLAVPEQNIINLKLPADSQLSIQGYKKVDATFAFQTFDRPNINGVSNQVNTTTINQELVVNLKGKVGSNVDVNVDYSDVNRAGGVDETKQDISIVYHGDPDSAVQTVSFGDLQLTLPNTEFAGFSKQLFGLEAVLKFDNFRLTTFFAQTKGIAVTKVFTGNTTQIDKTYSDISYIPWKYFYISRPQANTTYLPQNGSEQIWVNPVNNQYAPVGTPNFVGQWEHWLPGRDYTIDYTTGIITFLRSLSITSQVAVGYTDQSGTKRGLNVFGTDITSLTPILGQYSTAVLDVPDNGIIDTGNTGSTYYILIKDYVGSPGTSTTSSKVISPMYLVNYFSLGTDKIIPPQQDPGFLFQVISTGTNNIIQTGQGGSASNPYVYNLNLDLNIMSVTNINFATSSPVYFPERPFPNQDGVASPLSAGGVMGNLDVYNIQQNTPNSLYTIHLRYKTQLSTFRLDNINILRGSETVYLDGRLLRRDTDYFIDYTTGFLDFQDKSILTPNSQIVVSYEYSPFGSFGAQNILGGRMEYDVTDKFFIGSTFLLDTSQQPNDTPQLGSTPNSLTLFDADAKYEMDSEDLRSITGMIPGLEKWKPPASLKLSGEIAQSYFDPDTYDAEGETGVAMVDNMEGIDSAITASLNTSSWLVSSAPAYAPPYLSSQAGTYDSGADSGNNRIRFYDDVSSTNVDFGINTSTAIPGGGGHVYAQTGQASDVVNVLQVPYARLTNATWAGLRQVLSTAGEDFSTVQYFQTWIYNDGKDKWIMFDFGVMNENSNNDPANGVTVIDSDSPLNQAHPNLNYGIPTFYTTFDNDPFAYNVQHAGFNYLADNHGDIGFIGLQAGYNNYNVVNDSSPGQPETSQEGQYNGSFVTQNMDGTGILNTQDNYFEYGIRANWSGWQLVNIPVNLVSPDYQSTTSNGISYFFHSQGTPNSIVIKSLRMWITGTSGTPIDGNFLIDSITFTHNLWQLAVDPGANADMGVTINPSKFNVNSISQAQNSTYNPNMRFIIIQPGQDQNAIQFNEKSLDITYNLSSADYDPAGNINGKPIYYTTRIFQQGLDFTDYQDLAVDMNIRSYNQGDIFFIRIGNDQLDYYQYNISMESLVTSLGLDNWGSVKVAIDGSGGNRSQVGTPYINKATQISFGFLSPNPPGGRTGEVWLDNLRTNTSNVRTGTARRLNAELVLGNDPKKPFATIDGRYREVDSGFTEIDQTSTHFQHSLQYGLDYSSNGIYLFGQPLRTQLSFTDQELYTEQSLLTNPYYFDLPNSQIDTATGSILYTKDLGTEFGRLTSVNLSGSTSSEVDIYQPDYLDQPGVQGNTEKYEQRVSLISTYDMPIKLWFVPIGTNQLTETYTLTHDQQDFTFNFLSPYDRTTYQQNYGWTNTTEVIKNLVFTPGFSVALTDAVGNTNSPGVPGTVSTPVPFVQQFQPKGGLVYRGIPGVIPSVTYSGSNMYDAVDYQDGLRFSNSNNVNYSLNVTPGSWLPFFQQINLTLFGGRTDSSTASIPGYQSSDLNFWQQWWITNPSDIQNTALLATRSTTDQLNASFKLFNVWDFRPTGSWTNQYSLLYTGAPPTQQVGDTLGLTTIYNKRLFTLPWLNLSVNSAQIQYTHTDSTQYDSAVVSQVDSYSESDIFGVTFPYEISKTAQGNVRYQESLGEQNGLATTNVPTYTHDYQFSAEYDQKFAPNLVLHLPFTHWKIQLHDGIEFKANFLSEYTENDSSYTYDQVKTQRYRGTLEFDYNALKNLRIGLTGVNEYYTDYLTSTLGYVLWQVTLSGEAKF